MSLPFFVSLCTFLSFHFLVPYRFLSKLIIMFSTLVIVGFIFGLAWLQQLYLNQLIAADRKYLEMLIAKRASERPFH